MLGNNLYKNEVNFTLNNDELKSLVFFYRPLVGLDALFLYQYCVLKGTKTGFEELNKLLSFLNISVDEYENNIKLLNEYRLVKTLYNEENDNYVFVYLKPLSLKEFVKDNILVRELILKASGPYYQDVSSELINDGIYPQYKDISFKLSPSCLNDWTSEKESYLKQDNFEKNYNFNTLFNVNVFLKNMSDNLLPLRFRTVDNLRELAILADLYSISYDKMRTFIPKIARTNSNEIDLKYLKYLCENALVEYQKYPEGKYDIPCVAFLMSLQDGKQVTDYDKKRIYKLAHDYYLSPSVINVLIEYCLKSCDNKLIDNFLYPVAADLHRNDVKNAKEALNRLDKVVYKKPITKDTLPKYDSSTNDTYTDEEFDAIMKLMKENE